MKLEPITSLILVYFPECARALRLAVLKRSGHRSSFKPDDDIPWLIHRRGRDFLEEIQAEWFDVEHHVAYDSYIARTRSVTPCHSDIEPVSAAQKYLNDIDFDPKDNDSEPDVSAVSDPEMPDPGSSSTADYLQRFHPPFPGPFRT